MTTPTPTPALGLRLPENVSAPTEAGQALQRIRGEIAKAVVGQDEAVAGVMVGLLCNSHVLLEGVPGTAKTLLVRSLAAAMSLDFSRVQFTPDLMPGDVTGSLIYVADSGTFQFRPGPVFTQLMLADEINRTPPKTQAALLEAMEEHTVTVDGEPRPLPAPFMVVATQNPIEFEGTYHLPEAQLDRFLMRILIQLPSREAEIEIVSRHAHNFTPTDLTTAGIQPVATAELVLQAQREVKDVEIHPALVAYVVDLVRATRLHPALELGASPRAAAALMQAARALAYLHGRSFVVPDDIQALAPHVLTHRLRLRGEARMSGIKETTAMANVLAQVPVPR